MQSFIAAMAKRFPISLAVTVGHPAMVGTGPLGGKAVETGLVIASTDALAADAVGARILGFGSLAVAHLRQAAILGVGEIDTDRFEYPALTLDQAFGKFTEAVYGQRLQLHTA